MRWLFLLCAPLALASCDALVDSPRQPLVVEAFFATGEPLPAVRVTRAAGLTGGRPVVVPDASVTVETDGRTLPFRFDGGAYVSGLEDTVALGGRYRVTVRSDGDTATATASAPARLRLSDLVVTPSDTAVRAVLLDTLRFDTTATGAREALVYPVAVDASWRLYAAPADTADWVRISVRPSQGVASEIVGLFFPGEVVAREQSLVRGTHARWSGGYAVGTDSLSGGRPAHRVTVAVVRSGADYARWFGSSDAPERREPVGNVAGGRGLVVGLSLDSVSVYLPAR